MVPSALKYALEKIESQAPSMYKRHYLQYLNALRSGDLQLSLASLRKYFDYSIKNDTLAPVQYSALNLAALYYKLDYPEKALSAIKIGMLYARDLNDQECLSYLLCWLHQLCYSHGQSIGVKESLFQPSEKQMLDSLASRTLLLKQYDLAALCELRKAKCGIEDFEPFIAVNGYLQNAKDLAVKHNLTSLWSSISLTEATALQIYGEDVQAFEILQHLLRNVDGDTSAMDESLAISRSALHLSEHGQLDRALELLSIAKGKFSVESSNDVSKNWSAASGIILIDAALNKGEYETAYYLLNRWLKIAECRPLVLHLLQIKCAVLRSKVGKNTEACLLLKELCDIPELHGSYVYQKVQAMIALADIYLVNFVLTSEF